MKKEHIRLVGLLFVWTIILTAMMLLLTSCFCFHKWQNIGVKKEATCEEKGISEQVCLKCDKTRKKANIPATGHTYLKWTVETEPTCMEAGMKSSVCVTCEKTGYETIPSLGHEDGEPVITKAATCTEDGEQYWFCTRCGTETGYTYIERLEHIESDPIVTKEPTCDEDGEQYTMCLTCKQNLGYEKIPAAHLFDRQTNSCLVCKKQQYPEIKSWEEFKAAGGTSDGYIIYLNYLSPDISHVVTFSEAKYIKLIGDPNQTYGHIQFAFKNVDNMQIDLVNVNLDPPGNSGPAIEIDGSVKNVTISFYGSSCSLIGAQGENKDRLYGHNDGGVGFAAISAKYTAVTLHIQADSVKIQGGKGGKGSNGLTGFVAESGKNGGRGGYAIEADKIIVTVAQGYSSAALKLVGGAGGDGGEGGTYFGKKEPDGNPGEKSPETNIPIVYQ